MKKFRLLLSLSLVAITAIPNSLAATPTVESLKTLLKVTKVKQLHDSMMAQVYAGADETNAMIAQQFELSGDALEAFNEAMDTTYGMLKEKTHYEMMEDIYILSYSEILTQEEVDGLIAFYSTPAGQALVNKMPLIMQKNMIRTQEYLQPVMEEVQKKTDELLQSMFPLE